MTALHPSPLALFWTGVVALAILLYTVLDGFDLGVGILFGTTRDPAHREEMMRAISPVWDGNETWLVIVGVALFAAFPMVYAVFLAAFYIPVLLLLFGLIFRGVAFEYRHRGPSWLWNGGFWIGSGVVAFVQGAAVGAMIGGIPVEDGQYAGGPFLWLKPLSVVCGVGLMLGYALLGAGWLVLKSQTPLRDWAYRRIPTLAGVLVALLLVAAVAALAERDAITAGHFGERPWAFVFPPVCALAVLGIAWGGITRRDWAPFSMTVLFFLAAFATLAAMFWPFMIPYSVTVANAAAPDASLSFLFWGAGLVALPVVLIYTCVVYWVFRGKLRPGSDG